MKYLSLSSRPCLDELLPSIADCIALEADADADMADGSPDNFVQYQHQIKGTNVHLYIYTDVLQLDGCRDSVLPELRGTVGTLLEEKKNFVCQIHEQQRQIEELTSQVSDTLTSCWNSDAKTSQTLH